MKYILYINLQYNDLISKNKNLNSHKVIKNSKIFFDSAGWVCEAELYFVGQPWLMSGGSSPNLAVF